MNSYLPEAYESPDVVIIPEKRLAILKGVPFKLSPLQLRIISALARANHPLGASALLQQVWDRKENDCGRESRNSVYVYMCALRKKGCPINSIPIKGRELKWTI